MSAISSNMSGFRTSQTSSFGSQQSNKSQQASKNSPFGQANKSLQGTQKSSSIQQGQRTSSTPTGGFTAKQLAIHANHKPGSSDYCPVCNKTGGKQSSLTTATSRPLGGQGGQFSTVAAYKR